MPVYRECPFVNPEGVQCGERVTSQGLHGHLVGHGVEGEELEKLKKEAKTFSGQGKTPNPPEKPSKESEPTQTPEGRTEPKPEPVQTPSTPTKPPTEVIPEPEPPEVQMINEMAARLETEIRPMPGMSAQVATYIIHRFKSETILQEDPNTLQKMIARAAPKVAPEFIANAIANTFQIKNNYNLSYLDSLRSQPTPTIATIQPNPLYHQTPVGVLPQNAQANLTATGYTQPPQISPEVAALVNEVKSLKTEMEKKDKEDKHRQELEQQEKKFQLLIDEMRKTDEAREKRHKEEMTGLKKTLEGSKDTEKFRELEGHVGGMNAKFEQSLATLKDMMTEQTFSQKEKDHMRELLELKSKIDSLKKDDKSGGDFFTQMETYYTQMDKFAERMGLKSTKKDDVKSEIAKKGISILDKVSDTLLAEDKTEFISPPDNEFRPVGLGAINTIKAKATEKIQKEIAEKEAEVLKMEAENLKLKELETQIESKKKEAQESLKPQSQSGEPEVAESKKEKPSKPEEPAVLKEPPQTPTSSPKNRYDTMNYSDLKKAASKKGLKATGKGITKEKLIEDLKKVNIEQPPGVPT